MHCLIITLAIIARFWAIAETVGGLWATRNFWEKCKDLSRSISSHYYKRSQATLQGWAVCEDIRDLRVYA